jgi:hypothetical protein
LSRTPGSSSAESTVALEAKAPPRTRDVTTEIIAEPERRREEATRKPNDDLLEALQPTPEPTTVREDEHEPAPELQLRELVARKSAAPASARPQIEREIDAALGRIEERRAAEARELEAKAGSLARSEIRLSLGFAKRQFYAVLSGSEEAFAISQPFRLRRADAPGKHAQRALSALVAELEHAGWTVVSDGAMWYEQTLELFERDPRRDPTDL